jgi:tRNASer (uridine44-2'-O)-methyltransferase
MLRVHALDPTHIRSTTAEQKTATGGNGTTDDPYLLPGTFLIGNHADELTPWVPVLATLHGSAGYLSIPCCPWSFDERFQRSAHAPFPEPVLESAPSAAERRSPPLEDLPEKTVSAEGMSEKTVLMTTTSIPTNGPSSNPNLNTELETEFLARLNLGTGNDSSAYAAYRTWLARLSRRCGWHVECEMLRIPSTRNWAIIGRSSVFCSAPVEDADAGGWATQDGRGRGGKKRR